MTLKQMFRSSIFVWSLAPALVPQLVFATALEDHLKRAQDRHGWNENESAAFGNPYKAEIIEMRRQIAAFQDRLPPLFKNQCSQILKKTQEAARDAGLAALWDKKGARPDSLKDVDATQGISADEARLLANVATAVEWLERAAATLVEVEKNPSDENARNLMHWAGSYFAYADSAMRQVGR